MKINKKQLIHIIGIGGIGMSGIAEILNGLATNTLTTSDFLLSIYLPNLVTLNVLLFILFGLDCSFLDLAGPL